MPKTLAALLATLCLCTAATAQTRSDVSSAPLNEAPYRVGEHMTYTVAWALGEIGDKFAIQPLIETLQDHSPDVRVDAIEALEKLQAKDLKVSQYV